MNLRKMPIQSGEVLLEKIQHKVPEPTLTIIIGVNKHILILSVFILQLIFF